MLEALIPRKTGGRGLGPADAPFNMATFTLSTEVPRPEEQRRDERLPALLPVAKLISGEAQNFCRIRNISAGGLMIETQSPCEVGTKVEVEFNSHQSVSGTVVWRRETSCGVRFDQDLDLRELLANRPSRNELRRRPPRLDITCNASIIIADQRYSVTVRDISLGGMKVAISDWQCVGKNVTVRIESLGTIKGTIRWYRDSHAGIVFNRPLPFERLAEWMGERIEIASNKAGAWTRTARF